MFSMLLLLLETQSSGDITHRDFGGGLTGSVGTGWSLVASPVK